MSEDRYHISMLFTSHVHGYAKGTWGKKPFTLTGGAGAPLGGKPDNTKWFYNYVKVNVSSKGVSYEVVKYR